MVSAITPPLNREWFYSLVLQPCQEGAARINLSFSGVDSLTLELRPLSMGERLISLITGILLMIPLIGAIVWLAMQTFGQPHFLTDPYLPEGEASRPFRILLRETEVSPSPAVLPPVLPPPPAAPPVLPPETTRIVFLEKMGKLEEESNWKIEAFPDLVLVTKQSDSELATSRYSLDGQIQEYHFRHQDGSGEMHVQMDGQTLRVIGKKPNQTHERVHVLKGSIPWVQQMTLGLKSYVLSSNQRFEFYIINPRDLSINKLVAEKKRIEEVPGMGNLRRVDIRSDSILYSLLGLGAKLWFDPKTGEMKKMIAHADPRDFPTITEWRRNDP